MFKVKTTTENEGEGYYIFHNITKYNKRSVLKQNY